MKYKKYIIGIIIGTVATLTILHGYTIYKTNKIAKQNQASIQEIVKFLNSAVKQGQK